MFLNIDLELNKNLVMLSDNINKSNKKIWKLCYFAIHTKSFLERSKKCRLNFEQGK